MSQLISGAAVAAIATMATPCSATTVVYTVNSQTAAPGLPGVNYWFFSGSGSLSYASGLADGTYDQSILSAFNQTTTFWLNVNNPNPPPVTTFTIPAATWNFGLGDLNAFSLTILNGNPAAAAFSLGPKLPTTSLQNFSASLFTFSFDSKKDPNATFLLGTVDNGIQLSGDLDGSVQAVPEPATWALMLVGFGAVGGAMRRRQRVSVSYA